jgi:hypothetical protein
LQPESTDRDGISLRQSVLGSPRDCDRRLARANVGAAVEIRRWNERARATGNTSHLTRLGERIDRLERRVDRLFLWAGEVSGTADCPRGACKRDHPR